LDALIPETDFSLAKSRLSDVMSHVVRDHQPGLISRYHGKETMLLLNAEDAESLLREYRFAPEIVFSAGEVTAQLPQFGVLGFGENVDEALADLLAELRLYTQRYFERASLYMQSDRRGHMPWLLRFALTPTDQQHLLLESAPSLSKR